MLKRVKTQNSVQNYKNIMNYALLIMHYFVSLPQ